jgi:cobyrinic acid a,c-diamide synthase
MWARIVGNQLVEIISHPKPITINSIQYPSSIFTRAWTNEERKAIGIIPYEYTGSAGDTMFHSSSESSPAVQADKVVVTRTKTPRDIDKIKATMKDHVANVLKGYLEQTDWIVIREQDIGTAKPVDLAKWRTDLRAKAKALETTIDSKKDVDSLEAMTISVEEGKTAEFNDWPVNPRRSS